MRAVEALLEENGAFARWSSPTIPSADGARS